MFRGKQQQHAALIFQFDPNDSADGTRAHLRLPRAARGEGAGGVQGARHRTSRHLQTQVRSRENLMNDRERQSAYTYVTNIAPL